MAKYNNENENSKTINLIGVGTEITGDISSSGDIRIDGTLTGNIDTKGKLVIGETGKVKGDIICKNSELLGEIEGKISVAELLSLKSTSKITGDIITKKLSIDPGSTFTGNCNMREEKSSDAAKAGQPLKQQEQKAG